MWKVPNNGKPSAADLKQMFVYIDLFKSSQSYLVYPRVAGSSNQNHGYENAQFKSSAGMIFIDPFKERVLDNNWVTSLVSNL